MPHSLWILLISTASVAFLHALAPDHWMPFAAIAKAQKWPRLKLLAITFISGIVHMGISIIFSIIALVLGFSVSKLKSIEGHRAEIALWLLIGFGFAYTIWGIKKAKEKKHKDIEEERQKADTVAVWTIFAVIVLGPCEPFIPIILLGYNYGYLGIISVSIIFSLVTIAMMMMQSLLAFKGIALIKNDVLERYAHAFAGLVIVLTGIFVILVGI